jgi:hypothetical protein
MRRPLASRPSGSHHLAQRSGAKAAVCANPGTPKFGRMDFVERNHPEWLFLSQAETIVDVPMNGLGDTSRKFVAYRQATGTSGELGGVGLDQLPKAEGLEKLNLGKR